MSDSSDPGSSARSQFKSGVLAAAAAYFCWGLFPLYWKLLAAVSSLELIAHRVVWCTVFVGGYLLIRGDAFFWRTIKRRVLWRLSISALLIGINWWVYIWAVNNDHVIESSLGYFINPLVNVVFGVVFLRERLNRIQWFAVLVAATGVVYLTIQTGTLPWIALALAFSFGGYGLIRKVTAIDPLRGLAIEGLWLLIPAVGFLTMRAMQGLGGFGHIGHGIDALLILTGPITAVPLLLFAFGARRIPLSLVGILQYIGPTLQFATGVLLYHEPFSVVQLGGFALIWSALAIYIADSVWRYRRAAKVVTQ